MELLLVLLGLALLVALSVAFGVDSRPADAERTTDWWPAAPHE